MTSSSPTGFLLESDRCSTLLTHTEDAIIDPEASAAQHRDYPADVHLVALGGREFVLVGTAHISRESVDLVREVIEKEEPDCVCIELDPRRYQALSQPQRFESLDLKQVIRSKQLATLMFNLVLASYQKYLGLQLGVQPGPSSWRQRGRRRSAASPWPSATGTFA